MADASVRYPVVEEPPNTPPQQNGEATSIWDLPPIPPDPHSKTTTPTSTTTTAFIVEEPSSDMPSSAVTIPSRSAPPSRLRSATSTTSSISIAMDGPNPSPHFVSLENVARLYLELKNERDFLVRESASIFNDRVTVVNQLRQLEVQLNEMLQQKGRLEETLDTLGLRDEENREKIAALDEKVSNISSESIRFEATVRGLKGDAHSVQTRGPSARPRPKQSAACERTLYGHTGSVLGLDVCSENGVLVTASSDRSLRTWDLSSGRRLDTLYGHEGWVHAVTFGRTGATAVSGSGDKTVKVWDLNDARGRGTCRATLRGHEAGVTCVQLDDDDVMVSGSLDRTLRRIDLNAGEEECTVIQGHENGVYCLQFLRHGLASGGGDSLIRMHDIRTGRCHRTLQGHSGGAVRALKFNDNQLVSGGSDHDLRFWDLRTATCTATVNVGARINALDFDAERAFVGCADRTLKVYDMESKTLIAEHGGHLGPIMSLAHVDEHFYTGSADQTTKVWNLASLRSANNSSQ